MYKLYLLSTSSFIRSPLFLVLVVVLIIVFLVSSIIRALKNSALSNIFKDISFMSNFLRQNETNGIERITQAKSLNSMDRIYNPLIARDFPELNIEALAQDAQELVYMSYDALNQGITDDFKKEAGPYLLESVERLIAMNDRLGPLAPKFTQVKIHNRALSGYDAQDGNKIITFQFALEAYTKSDANSEERLVQYRNELKYLHLQNPTIFAEAGGESGILVRNCPNCGAPLNYSSPRVCEYCGSGIKTIEVDEWLPSELIANNWIERV